jgi:hypothetical protein
LEQLAEREGFESAIQRSFNNLQSTAGTVKHCKALQVALMDRNWIARKSKSKGCLPGVVMAQCEFIKKDGSGCVANALIGKTVCVFHDPERREEGQEARRAGGKSRSKPPHVLPAQTPEAKLDSVKDVTVLISQTINQVRRGDLEAKVANSIGYLAGQLLKAQQLAIIEGRLDDLEKSVAAASKMEGGSCK